MTERWIVVQSQPRREQWAAENIHRLGYEFYFPKIYTTTIVRGLRVGRAEPLFPRHLFVRSDKGQWRSLTGCWGVAGVIMQGPEAPGFVSPKELARLRECEDKDGMVILPTREPEGRFVRDERVRVTDGAFNGLEGIYEGDVARDRVRVLLNVLGRKTSVLIAAKHVEAAG